jgi:hypothetical protein
MVVDPNVYDYFNLYIQYIIVRLKTAWFIIKIHPKNPITNFLMERKYLKIAKELENKNNV